MWPHPIRSLALRARGWASRVRHRGAPVVPPSEIRSSHVSFFEFRVFEFRVTCVRMNILPCLHVLTLSLYIRTL